MSSPWGQWTLHRCGYDPAGARPWTTFSSSTASYRPASPTLCARLARRLQLAQLHSARLRHSPRRHRSMRADVRCSASGRAGGQGLHSEFTFEQLVSRRLVLAGADEQDTQGCMVHLPQHLGAGHRRGRFDDDGDVADVTFDNVKYGQRRAPQCRFCRDDLRRRGPCSLYGPACRCGLHRGTAGLAPGQPVRSPPNPRPAPLYLALWRWKPGQRPPGAPPVSGCRRNRTRWAETALGASGLLH